MSTHFKEDKERITCTGGSLDGRELWITKGIQRFEVLGHKGTKEPYLRDGERFIMVPGWKKVEDNYMPCSQ